MAGPGPAQLLVTLFLPPLEKVPRNQSVDGCRARRGCTATHAPVESRPGPGSSRQGATARQGGHSESVLHEAPVEGWQSCVFRVSRLARPGADAAP